MSSHASFHRAETITKHPPYGLYLDPHRGQHNWTAASSRLFLIVLAVIVSILGVAAFGPH
jgi:hypothetical protein